MTTRSQVEVAATTPLERGPRITALAQRRENGLQALMEIGAKALMDGYTDADGQPQPPHTPTHDLALQILGTFEPEVPEFEEGDEVRYRDDPRVGKVVSRYLNEDGEWEYQVRFGRVGNGATTTPYGEAELREVGA